MVCSRGEVTAGGAGTEYEADDCLMLFLPAHPRPRCCCATRCGNRARVARCHRRHQDPGTRPA
ncbi:MULTISPECIES: hypothetical protein [unclassified Streptomyces]|uniref:hypothetical protein n=1 Tax=unclassified Streptomyces TaxID=2593676 RepID=UPI000F6CE8AB|nr:MULTISPECIES: hypothetical protein [unclassified Streptomyces]AZM58219.1 hypothetical protein DLM49_00460 [Streptomyces sp. WAC 01438]RSM98980.1 hypothetical protein DMA10_07575 [Streptomyces sp. WAC 01420]